jgi:hypothetical protein
MGSEFSPPQLRQRQALELEGFAKRELIALKLFTEKPCPSTPKLLGYKVGTQGPQDLVPGGFIVYVLMEKLPGYCLGRDAFWDLDESERADIRQKFKTAWMYVPSFIIYISPILDYTFSNLVTLYYTEIVTMPASCFFLGTRPKHHVGYYSKETVSDRNNSVPRNV